VYEPRRKPLLPRRQFFSRLAWHVATGMMIIAVCLGIGMMGYHYFEKMSWLDAFANASMILSGMGPLGPLQTSAGKWFAGFYALFSGLALILIVGIIFAPVAHRFFHKFHMDDGDLESKADETKKTPHR